MSRHKKTPGSTGAGSPKAPGLRPREYSQAEVEEIAQLLGRPAPAAVVELDGFLAAMVEEVLQMQAHDALPHPAGPGARRDYARKVKKQVQQLGLTLEPKVGDATSYYLLAQYAGDLDEASKDILAAESSTDRLRADSLTDRLRAEEKLGQLFADSSLGKSRLGGLLADLSWLHQVAKTAEGVAATKIGTGLGAPVLHAEANAILTLTELWEDATGKSATTTHAPDMGEGLDEHNGQLVAFVKLTFDHVFECGGTGMGYRIQYVLSTQDQYDRITLPDDLSLDHLHSEK